MIPYISGNVLVEAINVSLAYYGGGAFADIALNLIYTSDNPTEGKKKNNELNQTQFFRPFKTKDDLYRIYSPITAPITFLLLAAELLIGCILNLGSMLISALKFDGSGIVDNAIGTGTCLGFTVLLCIAAIASPLINLIDVLGSTVNTVLNSEARDHTESRLNCP